MTSHNTNTDLTEEDAADLQFPKELTVKSQYAYSITNCANCENELSDVFILCNVCDVNVCNECFANGAEFGDHKSDHAYKILNNDFALFDDSDWTAREEMLLINGLMAYNNWNNIAKDLPGRSVPEIKDHYENYYLNKLGTELFNEIKLKDTIYKPPVIPYRFRLTNVNDPMRNITTAPAGYNAARSDFECDYDKSAEDMIASLETLDPSDPYYSVLSDLQQALMNSYRRRICERQRRKSIIREHGLIMQQKTASWLQRYILTIPPNLCEKMIRFMQFYSGQRFEYTMEGLHRVGELKIHIARLCEFRGQGIKTLAEAQLYTRLKQQRDDFLREVKQYQHIAELNVKQKNQPLPVRLAPPKKRTMTPLEILAMPGFDKLLPKERDLCRAIRLTPLTYLDLKAVLISENGKLGFLKLLTARKLLKIDVNKTRKLYDFLLQEGYINKPKD